jgi:hypothetical protein
MDQKRAVKVAIRLAEERMKKLAFEVNAARLGLPAKGAVKEYEQLKAAVQVFKKMLGDK